LALSGLDQILSNLNLDMRNSALLAVHRYREISGIADRIGFVDAYADTLVLADEGCKISGKSRISVEEQAYMPGSADAFEDRGEAVHGDQYVR